MFIRTYVLGRHREVTTLLSGKVGELSRSLRHFTLINIRRQLTIHMSSLRVTLETIILRKSGASVHEG